MKTREQIRKTRQVYLTMNHSLILPFLVTFLLSPKTTLYAADNPEAVNIGSRRELFVDNTLIEKLAYKPVRLRFVLRDADLYSFHFPK